MLRAPSFALLFVACAHATPPPAPPPPPPLDLTPKAVAAPPPPPPRPKAKVDPCPVVPPDAVSDDDAPILSGVGTERFYPTDWLAARGVSEPPVTEWFANRFQVRDRDLARTLFYGSMCHTATVGDPAEEAIVCEMDISTLLMQRHALVLVVRQKRLALVLDVGLGLKSLDWPDRPLDLTFVLEPGGKGVRVSDRAPDGTVLFTPPPSACREYYASVDRCEQALAEKKKPEETCRIIKDAEGNEHAERLDWDEMNSGAIAAFGDEPITLHDCAAARRAFKGATADKDVREAQKFVEKSCNDRGHWTWKDGRFVKDPK